jgi:tetratricopeptide (TPR) repeat protein
VFDQPHRDGKQLPSLSFSRWPSCIATLYDLSVKSVTNRFSFLGVGLVLFAALGLAQVPADRQQKIEVLNRKAQAFLHDQKPELAIPEFQAIVGLDPRNVEAQANLGVLLFFRADYAGALPHLRAALKLKPSLAKIQALLGICERRNGEASAGLSDLEASFPALTEKNIRIQVGMELIESYSASGDLDKASATVSTLRSIDPTNVAILYAAYRIYSDQTGETMLTMALTAPDSAQTHQMMAHELSRQGDIPASVANYREALKIDPKLPGLHFELAEVLNTIDTEASHHEAEAEYQAAVAANPHDEKAVLRLGEIADKQGDHAKAITYFSRALELSPNDADAMLGLAKAYTDTQQQEKALPLLERAVKIDPSNATAHFRLATLYRHAGRQEDAEREMAEYKKYKELKAQLRETYKKLRLPDAGNGADQTDAEK